MSFLMLKIISKILSEENLFSGNFQAPARHFDKIITKINSYKQTFPRKPVGMDGALIGISYVQKGNDSICKEDLK